MLAISVCKQATQNNSTDFSYQKSIKKAKNLANEQICIILTNLRLATKSLINITLVQLTHLLSMVDTILTIKDVAAYLKVNERTVYRLAASGNIPAFKVGGSWRFRKDALELWITDQSNQRIEARDH